MYLHPAAAMALVMQSLEALPLSTSEMMSSMPLSLMPSCVRLCTSSSREIMPLPAAQPTCAAMDHPSHLQSKTHFLF